MGLESTCFVLESLIADLSGTRALMPDSDETAKVVVTMALSVPLHQSAPCIQFMQMYPLYIFRRTFVFRQGVG